SAKICRVNSHAIFISTLALGYVAVIWLGHNKYMLYGLMAFLGIGWAAVISLPFAIMSEKIEQSRMGLYMGLFNLSVVLPQLLVSLGIGLFISKAADKGLVFQVSAVALAVSAVAWFMVREHESVAQTDEQSSIVESTS
ncbi:MAG: MFS transporter, partial [Algicola sp.]|nr:MFS transporter [Algicola sp.]